MYIYIYIHVYIYTCLSVCMYVCMCVCVCVYMSIPLSDFSESRKYLVFSSIVYSYVSALSTSTPACGSMRVYASDGKCLLSLLGQLLG